MLAEEYNITYKNISITYDKTLKFELESARSNQTTSDKVTDEQTEVNEKLQHYINDNFMKVKNKTFFTLLKA
jgi:hypothetical protein